MTELFCVFFCIAGLFLSFACFVFGLKWHPAGFYEEAFYICAMLGWAATAVASLLMIKVIND